MFSILLIVGFSLISSSDNYNSDSIQIDGFNDIIQWVIEPRLYKENSASCRRDLEERSNIIEMLDSTSKLQSGILRGNYFDLGSFDECIKIIYNTSESDIIRGQYCLIQFKMSSKRLNEIIFEKYEVDEEIQPKNDYRITAGLAVCMPESCSQTDIEKAIEYLQERNIIAHEAIKVSCTSDKREQFSVVDWVAIGIYTSVGLLLIFSTGYDVYLLHYRNCKKSEILSSFSMYTNGKKLLTIKPITADDGEINCLHGLRSLSIASIIIFHRSFIQTTNPLINTEEMNEWTEELRSTYISGLTVAVDTFLVMSGLLLTYNYLRETELSNSFNAIKFYVKRYLRLTPAFAATVLMMSSLVVRFGNGPLWKSSVGYEKESCIENWWMALSYIQNYSNPLKMCLLQTWYLSVEMQLFLLSPLILIPLRKYPKYAVSVIVILLLTSIGIIIAILMNNDFNFNIINPNLEKAFGKADQFANVYLPTHMRYGPWLAGVLSGYILYQMKNVSIKHYKNHAAAIWFIVIIAMLLIVLGTYCFTSGENYSNTEAIAYFSLHRISWALCICWIILMCHHEKRGVVNWFLSWGFWQPISRLSYCIYLIHFPLQRIAEHSRTPSYFSDANLIFLSIRDMACALLAAVIWSLAFEQPFLVIVKQIFKKKISD